MPSFPSLTMYIIDLYRSSEWECIKYFNTKSFLCAAPVLTQRDCSNLPNSSTAAWLSSSKPLVCSPSSLFPVCCTSKIHSLLLPHSSLISSLTADRLTKAGINVSSKDTFCSMQLDDTNILSSYGTFPVGRMEFKGKELNRFSRSIKSHLEGK